MNDVLRLYILASVEIKNHENCDETALENSAAGFHILAWGVFIAG